METCCQLTIIHQTRLAAFDGAYYRIPPEDNYAVDLTPNLSTYGWMGDNNFNVGISNTHLTSSVTPSGQFSWAAVRI